MEIRVLRYFLAIAREGNISRAAELLHITQPTLSRQIQELERELNTTLFIRGKSQISLTDAGMLLRRRAHELVELADKTAGEFLSSDDTVSGVISIGAGESLAVKDLARAIGEFSRLYPDVRYEMYTGTADHIKEQIEHGILDMGLMLEPIDVEKYEFVRLSQREKWVAVMRREHPLAEREVITPEDLTEEPLIIPRRTGPQAELRRWFGDRYNDLHIIATSNLPANSTRLVLQGLGISLHVEGAIDMYYHPDLRVIYLEPELSNRTVLVWKRFQPFGKASAKFIEFFREKMEREQI